ncbi:hypothetical protein R5R35_010176 [Gryllus longicercus]|uniref:N-acetylglucosamine-1-phosphotransferase subunits alpha/beta n=2 Tax=Gryllus longicercus TaxID=2509291 RepID=A0AAN9Z9L8_9ORTH
MSFIMGSWKILQRRTYDILSHKYSFVFVLLAFLILTVSVIQFGEVWIEWNQTETVYSSFSDNVVGKSLQKKLCQTVPIDVVYTWVNGSDPLLLQQMQEHRNFMMKKSVKCQFTNCMPSHYAAYRGWMKYLDHRHIVKKIQVSDSNNKKGPQNWTLVEFSSPQAAESAAHSSVDLGSHNMSLSQAYWTSDQSAPNSYLLHNAVICTGLASTTLSKIKRMTSQELSLNIHVNIRRVWLNFEVNLMSLELPSVATTQEILKMDNVTVLGQKVNISKAYLILELPPPWDMKDLAPSRFEDKEELRYSLRSLETHAPWVRHIYLVTNGQIPYWLNLDNPRLTLLTHEEIFPNHSHLPTFSSPAIESHIHRIPGLSQQFLYLNDDVFFGQEVWPDDFITHTGGQKVYLSWPVPDCTESCPWSWIGDGSCDISCNISDCSFDGGDCSPSNEIVFPNEDVYDEHHSDVIDSPLNEHHFVDDSHLLDFRELTSFHNGEEEAPVLTSTKTEAMRVQRKLNFSLGDKKPSDQTQPTMSGYHEITATSTSLQKDMFSAINNSMHLVSKNETEHVDNSVTSLFLKKLYHTSDFHSMHLISKNNDSYRQTLIAKNYSRNLYNSDHTNALHARDSNSLKRKWRSIHNPYNSKGVASWANKRSKDTFAESLLFVNRLYNNEFGFEVRKVPAHMPHLIDKNVMEILQARFPHEWEQTSSHKVRSAMDMQFAFSYFYFLMSEKQNHTISEIFDKFDTDHSGTWSDREIRTLLTQLNDLPLSYQKVVQFEDQICNCSLHSPQETPISTPPYERYQDSKLPVVSKMLISNCEPIKLSLLEKFGSHKKYQTEVVKEKNQAVTFKMLSSNLSQLIVMLDEVRRDPKKFICLNDNLDPNLDKDNTIVRAVLQDFFESLFPLPSAFELPPEYRNRFLHVSELKAWRSGRSLLRNGIYLCLILLLIFTLFSFLQIECCTFQRRRPRKIYQDV